MDSSNTERKPWIIDATSFEGLLAALSPDRAMASAEYERLRSFELNDVSNSADQFSLIMGILF